MKRDLTGHIQKVQSLLSVAPGILDAMPRRHVAIATAVAVIWGVNFVVIHVGLDHFPPLLFAGAAVLPGRARAPLRARAPACRSRYVIAVGVFLSAGQFALLFLGMDAGMPAGLASLVLQLQAAFTVGLAVLLLGERPPPAQLAGGALALAGIGDHRRRPRVGRAARRARADGRRRGLAGASATSPRARRARRTRSGCSCGRASSRRSRCSRSAC